MDVTDRWISYYLVCLKYDSYGMNQSQRLNLEKSFIELERQGVSKKMRWHSLRHYTKGISWAWSSMPICTQPTTCEANLGSSQTSRLVKRSFAEEGTVIYWTFSLNTYWKVTCMVTSLQNSFGCSIREGTREAWLLVRCPRSLLTFAWRMFARD